VNSAAWPHFPLGSNDRKGESLFVHVVRGIFYDEYFVQWSQIRRNFRTEATVESGYMDVGDKNRHFRPAVLVVVCLLHGGLIIVLLRAKPTYKPPRASELTIYLVNPVSRDTPLQPLKRRVTPHRSSEIGRVLRPESLRPSAETAPSLEEQTPATPPAIDWLAEAQRSAAEIVGRAAPDRATFAPSSPTGVAPWDPHPERLEATGHGLKLRIIGPCFSDLDLGQTVYGAEARLQLGCTLGKRRARGDLFDSIVNPRPDK
jgi:hypothetical protein